MPADPLGGGAVVTGASSGIGAAVAMELARRGLQVACLSRRGSVPTDADHEACTRLTGYRVDVTDAERVTEVLKQFAASAGGIQALVNSAGRHVEHVSGDLPSSDLRALLELNLVALVECCRQMLPYLRESQGTVINIGSVFSQLGVPRNLAYSASKAAVASVTRTLAVEWAAFGIRALTVAPGYVRTAMNADDLRDDKLVASLERRIPARRLGTAGEIAQLVAILLTERVDFLSGETIVVDGAQSIRG